MVNISHSRNATSIIHAAITDFCIYIHTPQTYVHSCNVIQTYCTFNSALHILFWPARPLIHFIRFFSHHAYHLTSKIYIYL